MLGHSDGLLLKCVQDQPNCLYTPLKKSPAHRADTLIIAPPSSLVADIKLLSVEQSQAMQSEELASERMHVEKYSLLLRSLFVCR